jgi:hypothetical protein
MFEPKYSDGNGFDQRWSLRLKMKETPKRMDCYQSNRGPMLRLILSHTFISTSFNAEEAILLGKKLGKKCFTVPVQVHWNLLRSCSGGEAFVFPTSNLLCGTWSGSPPTAAIPSRCELLNYQRAIHSNHIPLAGMIPQCWSAPAICQKDISMRFLYPQDPIDMSMICPKNLHEMSAFRRVENRIGLPCGSIIQDPSRGGWKPRGLRRRFRGDFPMIPSYSTDGWAVDVVTSQLGFDLPGDTTRVTLDWRFVMINQRVNVTNWKIGMFERKIIILINLQIGHVPELC